MTRASLSIEHGLGEFTATMPPAGNRWIIGMGFGLAAPWLFLFAVGSVATWFMAPPELKREAFLGAIAINLLFFIMHILAVAAVWLAFYNLGGTETLEVNAKQVVVRRRGMRLSVPIRLRRGAADSVKLLDTSLSPGRWPHPRLEFRTGGSAMRCGAGLTAEEAARVCVAVAAALAGEGWDAGS